MGESEDIIKDLRKFKSRLSKMARVDKMIFFGSRVKGKPHKYSDIDLIVVSPYFRKIKCGRGAKLYDYWNLSYPVDFLCYTPEEFRKLSKRITIVREAIREGIAI